LDTASRPPQWVAHTPSKKNPRWHLLTDHIFGVTDKAVTFAAFLDDSGLAAAWARYLGLLHDLGKFTEAFQKYLWDCHRADLGLGTRPKPGSAPHKQMGALAALEDLQGAAEMFALPIYGHHGGMEMPSETRNKVLEKTTSAEVALLRRRAEAVDPCLAATAPDLAALVASPHARTPHAAELFLRMLYSCLTDADALDTEAHMNPDETQWREIDALGIADLRDRLRECQERDFAGAEPSVQPSVVNQVRREVYDACRTAALLAPGVFALTVPTGGGKTRSGLAFALEHAAAHGLRRVIYAIPYTSIVDQTAQVFRALFGNDPGTILEHHSAIEPKAIRGPDGEEADGGDAPELWRRLAAQNWDAPLVVTTTVQLFESLFSNRPGACRKLHRLAQSVIVLDEVQTLPAHLLTPLTDGLKTLAANFGVTVVLCTATQPALEGKVSPFLDGFASVKPIIPPTDRDRHFALLRRVRYRVETEEWDWDRVALEMREGGSCLCILNTRRQARQLLDVLDPCRDSESVFHLSTLMCGHHRRAVLAQVRQRLKAGLPTLLVSTSLVECGVDLDFPRVLRAIGPLDRIIQAAGRCNREGRRARDESEVVIFTPQEGGAPSGLYLTALRGTLNLHRQMQARGEEIDFDDPSLVTRYFARLYGDLQGGVDKAKDGDSVQQRRAAFDYREVAKDVKLVDEDTVSVLVTQYPGQEAEARAILDAAEAIGGMTRGLWRRAQPLCVSLPRTGAETGKLGVDPVPGGLYVWEGDYDVKTGIPLPEDMAGGPVYNAGALTV
jgi:CRISPR-associated endonuclease/helicase Cas3